ncbi:hypothetical protein Tco_1217636 [Tanacetum coccineum]
MSTSLLHMSGDVLLSISSLVNGAPLCSICLEMCYSLPPSLVLLLPTDEFHSGLQSDNDAPFCSICTDISKITRKSSQNGQTRTQERKNVQEPEAKVKNYKRAPNTFTVHVSSPFHQAVKSRGKSQSKVKMDNSEARLQDGRVKNDIPRLLISHSSKDQSWLWQRSTRGLIFYTKLCLKETQGVSITDCHAGNPCELPSDLTANNDLPIIEGLYRVDREAVGCIKGPGSFTNRL